MANSIVTILCEGPHDVAFICRIFKTQGFKAFESVKIDSYPHPFDKLLVTEASKTDIEQLNLSELRRNLLPANVLKKDDTYIFLYSLGGDGKILTRQKLLKELTSFVAVPANGMQEINAMPDDTVLKIIYFFDADANLSTRLAALKNEITEIIPNFQATDFTVNPFQGDFAGISIGSFIFTGADNHTGSLENILVPLMELHNEEIFTDSRNFLQKNFLEGRLFPLKLAGNPVTEARSARLGEKAKYDELKSIIAVAGQLQRSGKSNVVCISDCDYITMDKINADPKCLEIIHFLEGFL